MLQFEDVEPFTLLTPTRLRHFGDCIRTVVREDVPGDIIETGVWKGGACIYARSVLDGLGDDRKLIVADSFEGFPDGSKPYLAVTLSEVKFNFSRFGYNGDERTSFVKGWFEDTLRHLEGPFSVIRLDADLYHATMAALEHLYPKLSPGGFLIQDDYFNANYPEAKWAVDGWLQDHPEVEPKIVPERRTEAIYWRK